VACDDGDDSEERASTVSVEAAIRRMVRDSEESYE
jgi:hypothetical protein